MNLTSNLDPKVFADWDYDGYEVSLGRAEWLNAVPTALYSLHLNARNSLGRLHLSFHLPLSSFLPTAVQSCAFHQIYQTVRCFTDDPQVRCEQCKYRPAERWTVDELAHDLVPGAVPIIFTAASAARQPSLGGFRFSETILRRVLRSSHGSWVRQCGSWIWPGIKREVRKLQVFLYCVLVLWTDLKGYRHLYVSWSLQGPSDRAKFFNVGPLASYRGLDWERSVVHHPERQKQYARVQYRMAQQVIRVLRNRTSKHPDLVGVGWDRLSLQPLTYWRLWWVGEEYLIFHSPPFSFRVGSTLELQTLTLKSKFICIPIGPMLEELCASLCVSTSRWAAHGFQLPAAVARKRCDKSRALVLAQARQQLLSQEFRPVERFLQFLWGAKST